MLKNGKKRDIKLPLNGLSVGLGKFHSWKVDGDHDGGGSGGACCWENDENVIVNAKRYICCCALWIDGNLTEIIYWIELDVNNALANVKALRILIFKRGKQSLRLMRRSFIQRVCVWSTAFAFDGRNFGAQVHRSLNILLIQKICWNHLAIQFLDEIYEYFLLSTEFFHASTRIAPFFVLYGGLRESVPLPSLPRTHKSPMKYQLWAVFLPYHQAPVLLVIERSHTSPIAHIIERFAH